MFLGHRNLGDLEVSLKKMLMDCQEVIPDASAWYHWCDSGIGIELNHYILLSRCGGQKPGKEVHNS